MNFKFHSKIPLLPYSFGLNISSFKGVSVNFLIVPQPTHQTGGFTSYCEDGKHVLLFDFDGIEFQEVLTELEMLQGYYRLSSIYVFKNDLKNSFHAVCLDKFSLYKAVEIISQTSADRAFKYRPLRYGLRRWVLRTESKAHRKKPSFHWHIPSENNLHQKSTPHKIFLNLNYKLKIGKLINEDRLNILDYFKYKTARV